MYQRQMGFRNIQSKPEDVLFTYEEALNQTEYSGETMLSERISFLKRKFQVLDELMPSITLAERENESIINIVKFVGFTLGSVVIRKTYNWLTEDVDPVPGTKEFGRELQMTEIKYKTTKEKI